MDVQNIIHVCSTVNVKEMIMMMSLFFQGGIVCCRLNEGNIPWHNICFTSTKALDQGVWFAVLWGTGQGRGREGEIHLVMILGKTLYFYTPHLWQPDKMPWSNPH